MFLSYLVTCHNETDSLRKLLAKLSENKKEKHEIIVLDDYSDNLETLRILDEYNDKVDVHKHKLNNDYGSHKNYGIDLCTGKYIFQLDSDEYPTDLLLQNIDIILDQNENSEVIWIPRLNYFEGVTQQDIITWGWQFNDGLINFPDYQSRCFKRLPYIRYKRRLHEKVEGFKSYTFIPPQKDYAIVHEKTIEKQRQTNINYNKLFTEEENKGYSVK
jgi:glycosyltransferase involved in cell wall biosynthesis